MSSGLPVLACITGALSAKEGEHSILHKTSAKRDMRGGESHFELVSCFTLHAKYRVCLAWLIKRLLC